LGSVEAIVEQKWQGTIDVINISATTSIAPFFDNHRNISDKIEYPTGFTTGRYMVGSGICVLNGGGGNYLDLAVGWKDD
jgi:hypothetical protein